MEITSELNDSPTLKFSELARSKNKNGDTILSLGLGEPAFSTPEPIIQATYDAMKKGHTKYSNPLGLFPLRKLIKEKLDRENEIEADIDQIIVTPGAKQALSLALMALLRPGDEVINKRRRNRANARCQEIKPQSFPVSRNQSRP